MTRPLLIGNWKMHGDGAMLPAVARVAATAACHPQIEVALCPPATLIDRAAVQAPSLTIGAQDCHSATQGAHTGEISAPMLRDAGARLVILGHSERRRDQNENDTLIAAKVRAAQDAGLRVVLCVGETHDQRAAGRARAVVDAQLRGGLDGAAPTGIVIAYEPVWAIGSGTTPTPAEVADMAAFIRNTLHRLGLDDVPVLYGGSVTAGSCGALAAGGQVDGFLVGKASLDPHEFGAMIESLAARGEHRLAARA